MVTVHDAHVRHVAYCSSCGMVDLGRDEEEAAEMARQHNDAHAVRHTCRYDDRRGDFGECAACRLEDSLNGRMPS